MKDILHQFVLYFQNNRDFQTYLENYNRFLLQPEGKFVKDIFTSIKGVILEDMLSKRFTKLSAEEKDIQQRTYAQVTELMDFLAEPKWWVRQRSAIYDALSKVKENK